MDYIIVLLAGLIAGTIINVYSTVEKFEIGVIKKIHTFVYGKALFLIIEAGTALLFLYFYLISDTMEVLIRFILIFIILAAAAVIDFRYKKIPNSLVVFSLLAGTLMSVVGMDSNKIIDSIITFIITSIALTVIYFVSKGGIGLGDVKLAAGISLLLGLKGIISVFSLAVILSGIAGLILLVLRLLKRKEPIPFSPFFLAGFLILSNYL